MVTSLFKHDRIRTTDVKAKELRRWADQLVTLAKRGDLHARRIALSIIRERDVVQKLFDEAQDRFGSVSGGYTRIVKIGRRPGDAAPVSIIELITLEDGKKKQPKKSKKTSKAAKPGATEAVVAEPETAEPEAPPVEAAPEASEAEAPGEKTAETSDAPAEVEAAADEAPVADETSEEAAPEEAEKKEE